MICSYPAHRQRLPASPSSTSVRVGCGVSASSATADDQLARDAEPALRGAGLEERRLQRVEPVAGGQALDRRHGRAVGLHGEHQARIHADVIDEDRARPALPHEAALLRAGQPEIVAQDVEEGVMDGDLGRARTPVHRSARSAAWSSSRPHPVRRQALDGALDRPQAQDVEHRQAVLGARAHGPRRRAGVHEQRLEQPHLRRGRAPTRIGEQPGLVGDEERPGAETPVADPGRPVGGHGTAST